MSTTWSGTGEVLYGDAIVAHVSFDFAHEELPSQQRTVKPVQGRGTSWRGWLTVVDGTLSPSGAGRSPAFVLRAGDGWQAPFTVERARYAAAGHKLRAQLSGPPAPPEEPATAAAPPPSEAAAPAAGGDA